MKKLLSGFLSIMMLGMTGTMCLPARAAEETTYVDTAYAAETVETIATTAPPSDVLQMSLNFSTIDRVLGTPLYLDGITASVFSQKDGYLVCAQPITDESLFKLDTFEYDHADRPGTYNVYVSYNGDQSIDLYAILSVNVYVMTDDASTDTTEPPQTFGPMGTVWTETTVLTDTTPFDTTCTTTADPYDTTDEADSTATTAVATKRTYRTTLPTTETSQKFDPIGTIVTSSKDSDVTTRNTETTAEPNMDGEDASEPTATTKPAPAETSTTEEKSETSQAGDINGDGKISVLDVIMLNKNLLCGGEIDAQVIRNADVDGDGVPSVADSLLILKYIIQLVESL